MAAPCHPSLLQVVQDFVQTTEDEEESPQEWLHRIMESSSREAADYDINLLGQPCMDLLSLPLYHGFTREESL